MFLLLFLIFSVGSYAQEIDDEDYNDPESYKDPSFYEKPDFDWDKVPADRIPDVPPDKLEYGSLNQEQRKGKVTKVNGKEHYEGGMTVEQIIAHVEDIENFHDVNVERAQEALEQKYNLGFVYLDGGARINDGHLVSLPGEKSEGTDQVFLSNKGSSSISVNKDGTIVVYPPHKETQPLQPLPDESFTAKKGVSPSSVETDQGFFYFTNVLRFERGEAIIPQVSIEGLYEGTWINGLKITGEHNDIPLIFSDTIPESSDKTQIVVAPGALGIFTAGEDAISIELNPHRDPRTIYSNRVESITSALERKGHKALLPFPELLHMQRAQYDYDRLTYGPVPFHERDKGKGWIDSVCQVPLKKCPRTDC